MCKKAKLTTSSPTIWEDWREIGGDLDSYFERVARPCSRLGRVRTRIRAQTERYLSNNHALGREAHRSQYALAA